MKPCIAVIGSAMALAALGTSAAIAASAPRHHPTPAPSGMLVAVADDLEAARVAADAARIEARRDYVSPTAAAAAYARLERARALEPPSLPREQDVSLGQWTARARRLFGEQQG